MNSNWSLRFPRTSREAYGYCVSFNTHNKDRMVFIACAILAAFMAGFMLGSGQ
jgi:hypothetical protein